MGVYILLQAGFNIKDVLKYTVIEPHPALTAVLRYDFF